MLLNVLCTLSFTFSLENTLFNYSLTLFLFCSCLMLLFRMIFIIFLIMRLQDSVYAASLAAVSRVEQALSEAASSLSSFTQRPGPRRPWMLQIEVNDTINYKLKTY